jgi:hypothetical protein
MSSFVVGGPFSFHVVKLSSMHRVGLCYWQKILHAKTNSGEGGESLVSAQPLAS